jgi:DNA-binding transcriptional ArsR family regulator
MNSEELTARLSAIASPHRMRILALLNGERLHVSELARRLGMSRALLYMHLTKLEEAGYLTGHLEVSPEGKALKFYELVPFTFRLDIKTVIAAIRLDDATTQESRTT